MTVIAPPPTRTSKRRETNASTQLPPSPATSPAETGERWEDHWPGPQRRPCFGYYPRCQAMNSAQAAELSPSEFARVARKAGGCGDCTIFHAQYRLHKAAGERHEAAAQAARNHEQESAANRAALDWKHAHKAENDDE